MLPKAEKMRKAATANQGRLLKTLYNTLTTKVEQEVANACAKGEYEAFIVFDYYRDTPTDARGFWEQGLHEFKKYYIPKLETKGYTAIYKEFVDGEYHKAVVEISW